MQKPMHPVGSEIAHDVIDDEQYRRRQSHDGVGKDRVDDDLLTQISGGGDHQVADQRGSGYIHDKETPIRHLPGRAYPLQRRHGHDSRNE